MSRVAQGRVYKLVLRCEYCDYTQEIQHQGPNMERGHWKKDVSRVCQNPICWAYKGGPRRFYKPIMLVASLK